MPHFHIPLQSGSDEVLRLMHRRYDKALFAHKIQLIKEKMPNAFIGVDVMVGCRGEKPELFDECYRFLDALDVTQLHVFPYSERPGTAALRIPYAVDEQEKKQRAAAAERFKENKTKGEAYLKANAAKEGVVTLPSGLQYQVLKEGNGRQPKATDQVRCHYEGTLINGTVFDSSERQEGGVATIDLKNVIKGWQIAIPQMPVGATWEIYLPAEVGYGENGPGPIPPFSALIFKITNLGTVK